MLHQDQPMLAGEPALWREDHSNVAGGSFMQVPMERSRRDTRRQASFWRESLIVLTLVLVVLSGVYLALGPIAAVLVLSLTLAALLIAVEE
jgi:hypothetical protein